MTEALAVLLQKARLPRLEGHVEQQCARSAGPERHSRLRGSTRPVHSAQAASEGCAPCGRDAGRHRAESWGRTAPPAGSAAASTRDRHTCAAAGSSAGHTASCSAASRLSKSTEKHREHQMCLRIRVLLVDALGGMCAHEARHRVPVEHCLVPTTICYKIA